VTNRRDVVPSSWTAHVNARAGRNVIAVIGIDRYQHWRSLSNAVNDALSALNLFQSLGFEEAVPPLLNEAATTYAITSLVTDDLRGLDQQDSLVLFYAGHGGNEDHHLEDRTIKSGYLIPADAELSDKKTTWIELESWLHKVSRLPPRHILVILDACYSGIALDSAIDRYREIGSSGIVSMSSLSKRRSRRIITSALVDEKALDNGPIAGNSLFTGYLIEGLEVGLAREGRKEATGSRIGEYVQRRVREHTNSCQTPDFGPFALDRRGEMVIPLRVVPPRARRESARIDAISTQALTDPRTPERQAHAAVPTLAEFLVDNRSRLGRLALEQLRKLVEGESLIVTGTAQLILNSPMHGAGWHDISTEPLEDDTVLLPSASRVSVAAVEQTGPTLAALIDRETDRIMSETTMRIMASSTDDDDATLQRLCGPIKHWQNDESSVLADAPGRPARTGRSRSILGWTGILMLLFVLGGGLRTYLGRRAGAGDEARRGSSSTTARMVTFRGQQPDRVRTPDTASVLDSKAGRADGGAITPKTRETAITVVSEPFGAIARLAGTAQVGTTPVTFSGLIKGRHYQVTVEKPGFVTAELIVNPEAGNPPMVILEPKPVVLHLVSTPSGAQIWVNGLRHDSVTPAEIELPPRVADRKRVTLCVRKRGYVGNEQTVSLEKLAERSDARVRTIAVVLKRRQRTAAIKKFQVTRSEPVTSEDILDEVNPYSASNSKRATAREPPPGCGRTGTAKNCGKGNPDGG
jgi:hypothetical protein